MVSFSLNFFFTNVMFVCRSSYHLPLHLRLNGRSIKLSGPDTIYWKFVTQIPSRDDLDVPPRRLYPTKCGNFSAELKPAKKDQCPLLLGMWTNTFCNLNKYILQFLSFSFLVGHFAPNLKKRWLLGIRPLDLLTTRKYMQKYCLFPLGPWKAESHCANGLAYIFWIIALLAEGLVPSSRLNS